MMCLNDIQITDWATSGGIHPFDVECVNPASIDLCLGFMWRDLDYSDKVMHLGRITLYPSTLRVELHNILARWFHIDRWPTSLLGITLETISIPDHLAGSIKLKTTPTRKGLGQIIADWVDPGFSGHITLMFATAYKPVELQYMQRICQLVLWQMDGPCAVSYNKIGHYMNQKVPTLAYE